MKHYIGTDIIEIVRVRETIERWGERFLNRIPDHLAFELHGDTAEQHQAHGTVCRLDIADRAFAAPNALQEISGVAVAVVHPEILWSQLFIENARRVAAREHQLRRQIQELRIEIDQVKKQQSVKKIVDSDYFRRLAETAQEWREDFEHP